MLVLVKRTFKESACETTKATHMTWFHTLQPQPHWFCCTWSTAIMKPSFDRWEMLKVRKSWFILVSGHLYCHKCYQQKFSLSWLQLCLVLSSFCFSRALVWMQLARKMRKIELIISLLADQTCYETQKIKTDLRKCMTLTKQKLFGLLADICNWH